MSTALTDVELAEIVVCPLSEDREGINYDGYSAPALEYVVHHCTRAELLRYGGVCRQCHEKIKRRQYGFLNGKEETPAVFERDLHLNAESAFEIAAPSSQDSICHCVSVTKFDFEKIDESLGFIDETEPDVRNLAARLFAELMDWIWGSEGTTPIRTAMIRFTVLTSGLRPELLGDRSFSGIAEELNVTKQAVSKHGRIFSEKFDFKFARQRPAGAVENMSRAMKSSHARRDECTDAPHPGLKATTVPPATQSDRTPSLPHA